MEYELPSEKDFCDSIDCRLPYLDVMACSKNIKLGRNISLNADVYVLYEICRFPYGENVSINRQRELVNEWSAGFDHPLKATLLRCAAAIIENQPLSSPEALNALQEVSLYRGQFAALAMASMSHDLDDDNLDNMIGTVHAAIRHDWNAARDQ